MYREHAPTTALRRHVACYWTLDRDESPGHRVLPDGCMDLLFDLTGVAPAGLVGTMTTALLPTPSARLRLFGVRFLPGEAFAFVDLPAGEARDLVVTLDDVWGRFARRLAERVSEAPDAGARIEIVEGELLARRRRSPDARVRRAVQRILSAPATARVASLAREVGLGERQLERAFVERVGVGPKALGRVARLQTLVARFGPRPSWAALASDLGYADQAHMVREVKRLAGVTPTQLFAEQARPAWRVVTNAMSDSFNAPRATSGTNTA